ncbi:hypothetical protein FRC12_021517 [Ceratobasidium sp. 428]|nr:hypothetical protein FRC12_021517 [Ceratobasidium sp. 428]
MRAVDPLLTTDDWKSHLKTFEDEARASELPNNNRYLDLIRAIERLEMMQADEEGTEPAILHGQGGKLELLSEITSMLWNLFRDSDDLQYLHSFIHFQTKAIQCTPNSSSDRLDRLFDLCVAYRHRFDHTGYVEDISAAIDFNAGSLVFRPRDREDFSTTRLNHLGELHQLLYERRGDSQAAVHAVDFKWLALQTISDSHPDWVEYLRGLGVSHLSRFECINFLGDIDISIECLEAAVSLVSNRHLEKPGWLTDLGIAYQTRHNCFGNLEDLENAVKWNEQANTLASDDHPEKPRLLNNLVASLLSRFMRMGRQEDVEKSVSCQKQAVLLTPDGHPYKPGRLNNLGIAHRLRYECLGRLEDLDDASISLLQALLNIEKEDPQSPVIVNNLSAIYQKLFERGGWSFDLTKSIDCCHEASLLNRNPQFDSMILNNLGVSHKLLFQHEKGREDIDKAIDYLERAVSLTPHGHLQKPEQLTNLVNQLP